MLYCPGKGQELLSALGVNLECHASSVFLVLKPPLSIIDALSKSIVWLLAQTWLAILEAFFHEKFNSTIRLQHKKKRTPQKCENRGKRKLQRCMEEINCCFRRPVFVFYNNYSCVCCVGLGMNIAKGGWYVYTWVYTRKEGREEGRKGGNF